MAKVLENVVVEVKAKMTVDRATAEACLKMVELYVNSNGVNVMVDKLESGELKFYYEPINASDGRCRFDGKEACTRWRRWLYYQMGRWRTV